MGAYTEIGTSLKNNSWPEIRRRLPESPIILQVYAVIAVLLSAWTLTAFLWKLPALLLVLNLGEIFTVFSYAMAANLLESLLVLFLLLAICVMLPPRFLCDQFSVRGAILSIGLIGSTMSFVGLHMLWGFESGARVLIGPLLVIVLTAALLHVSSRIRFVATGISWLADRLTVFLFVLLPLFILLSAYVIF
jgi:hypothetical protein